MVYNTYGSLSYLDAAIYSFGVGDEQLIENLANRLKNDRKQTTTIPWPPQVAELEREGEFPPLVRGPVKS